MVARGFDCGLYVVSMTTKQIFSTQSTTYRDQRQNRGRGQFRNTNPERKLDWGSVRNQDRISRGRGHYQNQGQTRSIGRFRNKNPERKLDWGRVRNQDQTRSRGQFRNKNPDLELDWRTRGRGNSVELEIHPKATVLIHSSKPIFWEGNTDEKGIAGFCWIPVDFALRFYAFKKSIPIHKFNPIVPTNKTSEQQEKFLGATMVRSSIFGTGKKYGLKSVAAWKIQYLRNLDKQGYGERFVLLTVYEENGKYDADIGVGGSIDEGESAIDGLERELSEETGKSDWGPKKFEAEHVLVKKYDCIEDYTLFSLDCDEMPEAAEASIDEE